MTKRSISREEYEQQKRAITTAVSTVVGARLSALEVDPSLKPFLTSLWDNRKARADKNGRLRDMSVYLGLRMFGVDELTDDHKKVIAAGEIYNMASYYQNWHLDDKKNVAGGYEAKLCHIASHIYRELAHELIMETRFSGDIKLELLDDLSESNKAIQTGQALELAGSRILDLEGRLEEDIISVYKKRCERLSGRFYGASFAMAPIMAEATPQHKDACREIGFLFGTGMQMVNDVGDFCLVSSLVQLSEKDYQDQFADMMKGTLTLPIYELSKRHDIGALHSRTLGQQEKEELLRLMVEQRSFDSTRKLTNAYRNNICRLLDTLPLGESRDMLKYQVSLCFKSNKFYVNLRENHGYEWGRKS